ncbi:hypothetical protein PGK19_19065, partial [Acinetobacter baumannii]|nr:hypothetical protein [Acinetobacter baumannii]
MEKAREVVEGAPEHSQFVIPCFDGEMYFSQRKDGKWFKWSNGYNKWLEYFGKCDPLDLAYSLLDVECLVESVDLVNSLGGLQGARKEAHRDCFAFEKNKPLLHAINDYES